MKREREREEKRMKHANELHINKIVGFDYSSDISFILGRRETYYGVWWVENKFYYFIFLFGINITLSKLYWH